MAVRGNSLMPFSIQAILNKKDESRHLPDLDMCFSKTACWKIFGEMNGASRRGDGDVSCEQTNPKNYDSDSGLSDDNDTKIPVPCTSEKHGDPASDVPEESLQETDHESAAAENAKSDSEPSNTTGKKITCSWFHKIEKNSAKKTCSLFQSNVANVQKYKNNGLCFSYCVAFIGQICRHLRTINQNYARLLTGSCGHIVQQRHLSSYL